MSVDKNAEDLQKTRLREQGHSSVDGNNHAIARNMEAKSKEFMCFSTTIACTIHGNTEFQSRDHHKFSRKAAPTANLIFRHLQASPTNLETWLDLLFFGLSTHFSWWFHFNMLACIQVVSGPSTVNLDIELHSCLVFSSASISFPFRYVPTAAGMVPLRFELHSCNCMKEV